MGNPGLHHQAGCCSPLLLSRTHDALDRLPSTLGKRGLQVGPVALVLGRLAVVDGAAWGKDKEGRGTHAGGVGGGPCCVDGPPPPLLSPLKLFRIEQGRVDGAVGIKLAAAGREAEQRARGSGNCDACKESHSGSTCGSRALGQRPFCAVKGGSLDAVVRQQVGVHVALQDVVVTAHAAADGVARPDLAHQEVGALRGPAGLRGRAGQSGFHRESRCPARRSLAARLACSADCCTPPQEPRALPRARRWGRRTRPGCWGRPRLWRGRACWRCSCCRAREGGNEPGAVGRRRAQQECSSMCIPSCHAALHLRCHV